MPLAKGFIHLSSIFLPPTCSHPFPPKPCWSLLPETHSTIPAGTMTKTQQPATHEWQNEALPPASVTQESPDNSHPSQPLSNNIFPSLACHLNLACLCCPMLQQHHDNNNTQHDADDKTLPPLCHTNCQNKAIAASLDYNNMTLPITYCYQNLAFLHAP